MTNKEHQKLERNQKETQLNKIPLQPRKSGKETDHRTTHIIMKNRLQQFEHQKNSVNEKPGVKKTMIPIRMNQLRVTQKCNVRILNPHQFLLDNKLDTVNRNRIHDKNKFDDNNSQVWRINKLQNEFPDQVNDDYQICHDEPDREDLDASAVL